MLTIETVILALYIIFFLVNIGILMLVLFAAECNKANKAFALYIAAATIWLINNYFEYTVESASTALFLARLSIVEPILMMMAMIWFAYLFPNKESANLSLTKKLIYFIFPSLLFLFVPTDLNIAKVEPGLWGEWEPGVLYTVAVAYGIAISFIATPAVLFKKFKTAEPVIKKQIKLILAGMLLYAAGIIVLDGILPELGYGLAAVFGPLSTVFFSLFVSIAIVKHHLFNAKVIAAQLFSGLIIILLTFNIYGSYEAEGFMGSLLEIGILTVSLPIVAFLIRSVLQEVKQKEQIEILAKGLSRANGELADLNEHLEEKVKEQTIEIRKAYEVEKKAKEELLALDKAKTDFILTTQHHLRTPLTIARTVLRSLSGHKKGDELSDMDVSFVQKGVNAADTLAELMNEFLEISQMEVGKSILQKQPASLHPLVQDIVDELSEKAKEKGLSFTVEFSEESKGVTVAVDHKRIKDAIANVISNAVTYTPAGGTIFVKGALVTHPIEKTQLYELSIKDSGIGMTKEEHEMLFTKVFERGARAKEVYATGKGIGLMFTRQIVEAHGGVITAGSEGRDKGTTFVIHLPIGI